jgi:hypothetical protein
LRCCAPIWSKQPRGSSIGRPRLASPGRRKAAATDGFACRGQEIRDAYRRLGQLTDPQLGGTPYLSMKINEARDVLVGE